MTLWQRAKWAFTNEGGYMWASIISAGAQFGLGAMGLFSQPSGKMTTAQKAFLTKQQAQQDQAYNFQQMLQPFLLDQMGLEATFGPGGAVTSIKKRALTKEEQQAKDIQGLAQEKVLKGLRGELDIDPATERNLTRSRAQTKEYVARTGGQSGDLSTAGQTAINLAGPLHLATLPIMVLTSEEGPGIEHRVLELGADDYIVKPFDPVVLLSRVNGVFRRLKVMAA